MFGQDRTELRRMYFEAWKKHCDGAVLSPLEAQIAQVVEDHPEYQQAVAADLERTFTIEAGETNPFLHMGLHLGIRDQVATDRPAGITGIFKQLAARDGNAHDAEHRMIDCLAETLWEAQNANQPPDEAQYIERLRRL
ncbi:MAG: DUF1841 family protein [Gammaproteobacteria bacterium]|nr:DUF1841 family protein [Gammaproteobacteria bacterium]MDH3432714.1 DUF1841 family protein [Gammaproteobacteria bacterium]